MAEKAPKALRAENQMQLAALVILLSRAGGVVTYTEADYQEVASRYGGTKNLAIHVEVLRAANCPPEVRLILIRNTPENGELVC